MKKLLSLVAVALVSLPVSAETIRSSQPIVKDYSLAAMGCMILLDCYEGIEKDFSRQRLWR